MEPAHHTEPLGGEDAAWLHLEDETNPMVVSALLELGGPLDFARFLALVERTVAAAPHFRARVDGPASGVGVPRWAPDPDFDLAHHVERVTLEPADAALRSFVGQQVGLLLPRDRPLWHLHVIDRGAAGTAVLCRIHHALADGFAQLALLQSLGDGPARPRPHTAPHGRSAGGVIRQAASLTRLIGLPHDPPTLLKHPLTREKRVAWAPAIPLAQVKAIARGLSATVNDVLVAAVAGALRSLLVAHGDEVAEVRAMVPVTLRDAPATTDGVGHHFGLVIVGLPLGIADPVERVAETSRRMARLQASPEAIVALGVLRAMGWAPPRVEDLGVAFFGKKASLVLTDVPGPRERLQLAGVPLTRLIVWVPQSARMGLTISLCSYAHQVTLGVLADAAVLAEPQVLVDAVQRELDALGARTAAAP